MLWTEYQGTEKLISWSGGICWILTALFCLIGIQVEGRAVTLDNRIVRGSSLEPLIAEGTVVTLVMDPSFRLEILRDDLVAVNTVRNPGAPVLKIVRGVPQDRFGVLPAEDGTSRLLINGQIVKNSQGIPYRLQGPGARLINAYAHEDKGVMPSDTYLLLGDDPSGSLDSTRFGLVSRRAIIGKVIKRQKHPS